MPTNEQCGIGSSEVWPLIRDYGGNARATLIRMLPTCSNAGRMGSATAPVSGKKSLRKAIQGHNAWFIAISKTLKKTEVRTPAGTRCVLHYTSSAAVCLFMQHPDNLNEGKQVDLAALRQAHPALETAYHLTQDFLLMMRKREGERLDTWLIQVQESGLPEQQSFAHGVEQDQAAVQAGLTLPINNGQVEGHVTRVKLIKRMMYGKASFALLRQRVLHRI